MSDIGRLVEGGLRKKTPRSGKFSIWQSVDVEWIGLLLLANIGNSSGNHKLLMVLSLGNRSESEKFANIVMMESCRVGTLECSKSSVQRTGRHSTRLAWYDRL